VFWRRKKSEPPEIATPYGIFTWDGDRVWVCDDYPWRGDFLHLNYWGGRFDLADLSRFGKVLGELDRFVELALASQRDEIARHEHSPEEMTLEAIDMDPQDAGIDFQLRFSFERWSDGNLGVHFRGDEVVSSCIDD